MVQISQMNCRLVDARIDGRGVDVDPFELGENVRLVLNRDSADLNAVLSRVGKRGLVTEQQEGTGL